MQKPAKEKAEVAVKLSSGRVCSGRSGRRRARCVFALKETMDSAAEMASDILVSACSPEQPDEGPHQMLCWRQADSSPKAGHENPCSHSLGCRPVQSSSKSSAGELRRFCRGIW